MPKMPDFPEMPDIEFPNTRAAAVAQIAAILSIRDAMKHITAPTSSLIHQAEQLLKEAERTVFDAR